MKGGHTMTNEERARRIIAKAGGHYQECLDWLNDGDVEEGDSLKELIKEWRSIGATYVA